MFKILMFTAALLLTPLAHAAQCDHPRSTLDAIHCKSIVYERADQDLNRAYKALTQRLSARDRITLRKGQRTWLREREQQCTVHSVDQGDGVLANCLLTRTTERTNWLNDRLRECRTVGCLSSKLGD